MKMFTDMAISRPMAEAIMQLLRLIEKIVPEIMLGIVEKVIREEIEKIKIMSGKGSTRNS